MSTIYSKTSMVLKNPLVFFREVRGDKLCHAMKFLAVLSMIPAVCSWIILIAVELPLVTGAYDANVVAFLLGTIVVIYVYFLYISGVLLSCFSHISLSPGSITTAHPVGG